MRSCLGVYCVLLALACPETSAKEAYVPPVNESAEQVAEDVSLVRLIANPELFDGKMIRTYGYLVRKHEEAVLYLSEESAENLILANGVRISFDKTLGLNRLREFVGTYVLVEGVFAGNKEGGPIYLTSGSVSRVRRVEPIAGAGAKK